MIYACECDVCGEVYVGETERSLRTEEHAMSIEKGDPQSSLTLHQERTGHRVAKKPMIQNLKVVETETRKACRKVKYSIQI